MHWADSEVPPDGASPPAYYDDEAETRLRPVQPAERAVPSHPLGRFVDLNLGIFRSPEFLIDDVLAAGMTLIAGPCGIGKTSALVPLMAKCAWLCPEGDALRPKVRRRVVYVTEDPEQARRVLSVYLHDAAPHIPHDEAANWFKLVPAVRMPAETVIRVRDEYATLSHTHENGLTALPVVVFDTRSACFEVNEENDNGKLSAFISTLRQGFGDIPIVMVTHTPKSNRKGEAPMTARGAGAQEADVQQVAFLTQDKSGRRVLRLAEPGKRRFESSIKEIEFQYRMCEVEAVDPLGGIVHMLVGYSYAVVGPSEGDKTEVPQPEESLRSDILRAISESYDKGEPLSRSGVRDVVCGNAARIGEAVSDLIDEGRVVVVNVPSNLRTNNNKKAFLVALDEPEHDHHRQAGALPEGKGEIPPSWRKPV